MCALDRDFTGADELRRIKDGGPERRLVAFVMEERAIPRQGMAIAEGGEVTSGTHSPMLDRGIGMGYVRPAVASPAGDHDRRARQAATRRRSSRNRSTSERSTEEHGGAPESYPEELRYHPEHDWARVEGDEATLGITWYAQDSLGELVHYEPPDVGATIGKDTAYGEVESVKAVSDLIAPLSGEVARGQPEGGRRARDGERRSLRRGLASPRAHGRTRRELDALLDAAAYRKLLEELA